MDSLERTLTTLELGAVARPITSHTAHGAEQALHGRIVADNPVKLRINFWIDEPIQSLLSVTPKSRRNVRSPEVGPFIPQRGVDRSQS